MIGVVHGRGTRVGGLVRYLYGPGKHEEHVNPRLVAAWSGGGDLTALEPERTPNGKRDYRHLVGLLQQPVAAAVVDPGRTVWHCSLRNAAEDRVLSDSEWAEIARTVMADTGLARPDDDDAVRWIAVRHNDDHIHVVATLVRQDGRPEKGWNDYRRVRTACLGLERRYGLTSTAPADRTAQRRPHRSEVAKARRSGRHETYRDQIRRDVRHAAAAAETSTEFFERLRASGLIVKFRYSVVEPTVPTGYSVALPALKTSAGAPVYYGGGSLARDLSLPKLRARWGEQLVLPGGLTATPGTAATAPSARRPAGISTPPPHRPRMAPDERAAAFRDAADQIRHATEEIGRLTDTDPEAATTTAQAAGDVLASAARSVHGTREGPLTEASDSFDRAAREPYVQLPTAPPSHRAEGLRSLSRLLALAGRISGGDDALAAAKLVVDLAALAESLAELREAQHRIHQARAARQAAAMLRAHASTGTAAPLRGDASTPRRAAGPRRPRPRPATPPATPPPDRRGRGR